VWLTESVKTEIEELEEKQRTGRGGKVAEKRAGDIKKKRERLAKITTVKRFSYNPNGDITFEKKARKGREDVVK